MTAAVDIAGVVKRFGDTTALAGIDAAIESGQLTGLVGPDGAGKTTLMRMMAALMAPTEGSIRTAGCDVVADAGRVHAVTGYMPQRFGLYEDLSVIENLRLYASLHGIGEEGIDATFDRLLHFTRLEPFKARLAGRLSGGMKQKLGLACALMAKPAVLLLDEPSVGVDPVSRQELWGMVQALKADGMAIVWSTSYLDEAERCDAVLLLNDGKLEYAGPPQALTSRLEGRSFLVNGVTKGRRRMLSEVLELPDVCDGVIQGDSVRVVLRAEGERSGLDALAGEYGGRIEATTPRFEDAFIDLLGGGPGGHSVIAEKMPPVRTSMDVAVSAGHLTKRFGTFTATDDVSFDVAKGEIFGLLGPNGAGKSTTFKMLCGLLKPTSGSATIVGYDVRHAPSDAKVQLGYMAQKFSLYGLLSVMQNLEFFSGVYGLRKSVRRERIDEMIETFELERYLGISPNELPLGYKQRLALACSLMHRPSVLFLDEPTSGVDPITRREFWMHINALVRRGVTVLVTTHFMDEAEYCDRVALMYQAKLVALDTPDKLKERTATPDCPSPTMEDAFIRLIEAADADGRAAA